MKDGLGTRAVQRLAISLAASMKGFPLDNFCTEAEQGLNELELKQRVQHLIEVLHQYLPEEFTDAAEILLRVKKNWLHGDESDPHRSFAAWPVVDYVAVYGIDHPRIALPLLGNLTGLFSAEFAIRPFITNHFEISYPQLLDWCSNPDPAVRRLVSEGTRPRLPWGERLQGFCDNPRPVLALLEELKDDPSEIVLRSVANNLNDIGKDHPDLLIQTCQRWSQQASAETNWVIRHATRSLVKAGHPQVFALLGHTPEPKVSLQSLSLQSTEIKLGESLNFSFILQSKARQSQSLVIDYAIHHLKNNQQQRAKVFKLKNLSLQPGERVEIDKGHPFKKISTRKYYPGTQALELLINGISQGKLEFQLLI